MAFLVFVVDLLSHERVGQLGVALLFVVGVLVLVGTQESWVVGSFHTILFDYDFNQPCLRLNNVA